MGTSGTKFVAPSSSTALLKYQVIVDFSDTAAGCSGTNIITTALVAGLADGAQGNGAPEFPTQGSQASCQLTDVLTSTATITNTGETTQSNLEITYLSSTTSVASKWEDRCGALILTPTGTNALPVDARLEVIDQTGLKTTYYRLSNGMFIISLAGRTSEKLQISLVSDLFPKEKCEYTFEGKLLSSDSLAGSASLNGTQMLNLAQQLVFVKEVTADAPSLNIVGNKRVYYVGETVSATVYAENCPTDTVLVLRLLHKDVESNTYRDTGWKQKYDTTIGSEQPNSVPLGQDLTGSCCLLLELRDTNGNVIQSVPYYFVIRERSN